jgi:membrane fusion protein, multidrug efflux system
MRLDDKSEECGPQFYRSHSATNLLRDSRLTKTDLNEGHRSAAESDSSRATGDPNRPRAISRLRHHPHLIAALFPLLSSIVYAGIELRNYFQSFESTNDAQVDSPVSLISSRITGTVTKMYVEDYERVKRGQLLVQLDPRQCRMAVEQARADLAQAEAEVASGRQEYAMLLAEIREAQARELEARRAEQRYSELLQLGVVSQAQYDHYGISVGARRADVSVDQADTRVALDNIAARQAEVDAAKIHLNEAILNLGYVQIVAPADGIVGRTIELGQRVEPGQRLMVLTRFDDLWVTADFKEKQLTCLHREQEVTIHVDALNRDYHGHVQRIFEQTRVLHGVLQAEATTANRIRVVRITFDPGQDLSRLRPGMPAKPIVWLNQKPIPTFAPRFSWNPAAWL